MPGPGVPPGNLPKLRVEAVEALEVDTVDGAVLSGCRRLSFKEPAPAGKEMSKKVV